MRFAIWLIGLFGVAVAIALFAGSNPGTITVFWPPYRVDLSLNLVLVVLFGAFLLVHLALRALAALFALPNKAQDWRAQQTERVLHAAFLQALADLAAGRFVRARRVALALLDQETALATEADAPPYSAQLRSLSHLLLAESAHALRDRFNRDKHLTLALQAQPEGAPQSAHDAVQLRAARWALEDGDADLALARLDRLPRAVARRTVALRLRLKAAQCTRQIMPALQIARLLERHDGLPEPEARGILSVLALELIESGRDAAEVQRAWSQLTDAERALPDVAQAASLRPGFNPGAGAEPALVAGGDQTAPPHNRPGA